MISVVIPNFNGERLLKYYLAKNLTCLESYGITDVIVVDDGSTDESVLYLQTHFPQVRVIRNQERMSFSKSCNRGASVAKESILLFLNNDMQIEHLDIPFITTTLEREDVFSVSGAIYRKNEQGESYNEALSLGFFSGGWLSSENVPDLEKWADEPRGMPLLWTCGGAMFVRREKFEELSGFDPLFWPFYVEDLDLCYRAWKKGWSSVYHPTTVCLHQHQSTIGQYFSRQQIELIGLKNKYLFIWKNVRQRRLLASHFLMAVVKLLTFQVKDTRVMLNLLWNIRDIWSARCSNGPEFKTDMEILAPFKPYVKRFLKERRRSKRRR